ncbi:5395_t:CDS:10, partial [Entrophospora sp. SA101]
FRYHGNNLKFIIIEIITSSSSLNKNNSNKESVGEPNDDYKEEEEIIYERKEIKIIKEIIENAFNNYNLFKEFGLNPPKGILLYGPSGTGKTLIFNAVASETNSYKIFINGPEVISKYYGETESKLKSIFEKALENSPSIIFIDEIDALCPKRDQVIKRVVAMMLTLMDGISNKGDDKNGKVIVIGSTNRPNSLDEALRRPGRFDKEIEIGIPNSHSRSLILQTLLKDIPSSLTIDEIESFSSKLHGYVGADLSAICREAGLKVIKNRVRNNIDGNDEDNNNKNDKDDIKITLKDLEDAMLKVRPSAMREIILEIPKVYWKDVGGQNEIKQKLKESIEWPLKYSEKFKNLGIKPPKGILMYGPPGCSKTLMAKALATEANLNFIAVKGPELFSKWVGESEKAVREIFRKARAASPSIIFFVKISTNSKINTLTHKSIFLKSYSTSYKPLFPNNDNNIKNNNTINYTRHYSGSDFRSTSPEYYSENRQYHSSKKANTTANEMTSEIEDETHITDITEKMKRDNMGEIKDAKLIFNQSWRNVEATFGRENICGKGTHTNSILKARGITNPAVCMSELLRSPDCLDLINKGQMIILESLFRALLKCDPSVGCLIDGFPRTEIQVECLKLLYDKMHELRREFWDTPLRDRFPRPTFRICVLYVDEDISVARQLLRGKQTRDNNKRVRQTGEGQLMEERVTDFDELLIRSRYKIFKKHYGALLRLREIFPFHLINAVGTIDEVMHVILREFEYQSSLELEHYEEYEAELFKRAIKFIDKQVIPMVQRHAISGQALIRTTSHEFEDQHLVDMIMDVLSERGFHVMFDDRVRELPVRIDMKTHEIILEKLGLELLEKTEQ